MRSPGHDLRHTHLLLLPKLEEWQRNLAFTIVDEAQQFGTDREVTAIAMLPPTSFILWTGDANTRGHCQFFLLRAPFGQYGPVAAVELYLYTAVGSRPGPGGSRTTASCQP